ncbi:MAG: Uma2 family endonuclease [Pseudomonadota bacterium]
MADDARPIESGPTVRTAVPAYRERLFTVAEFDRMGQVGLLNEPGRHELRSGRIIVAPPAGTRHSQAEAAIVALLNRALDKLDAKRQRHIVQPHAGLQLATRTFLEPDVAVAARIDPELQRFYAPADIALVIEVSHTSLDDDLTEKREKYAAAEIPEYWVLDVTDKALHVFRTPARGDYGEYRTVKPGETISPLFEPGIDIDLADLF